MLADIVDGLRVLILLGITLFILLAIVSMMTRANRAKARAYVRTGYDRLRTRLIRALRLDRVPKNPILEPRSGSHWESEAVFNPAAVLLDGRVHLLYRAIGSDGISRWGYASSLDGIHFDKRFSFPVFAMLNPRGRGPRPKRYDPVLYPSGGSWGGAEDPRAVILDGRVYVTFNAFDGWDFLRVAATSTSIADFSRQQFHWADPLLLSPEKVVNKNWVLFPERIGGKIAILHSITPTVQIEYVDRLEELGTTKQVVSMHAQKKESNGWEKTWRSAGPPPLATTEGWLVFYHAHCASEPHRYKLGAMLLDKTDPTRILHRAITPLLEPNAWYENDWKPGIVYACGAVIKDGDLFVYYGGGDKTVNVARTRLDTFLAALKQEESADIEETAIVLPEMNGL